MTDEQLGYDRNVIVISSFQLYHPPCEDSTENAGDMSKAAVKRQKIDKSGENVIMDPEHVRYSLFERSSIMKKLNGKLWLSLALFFLTVAG